jgi:single-stranded-DNA-specific exonuclease
MITLEDIRERLDSRFRDGFHKLSSIPDPKLLKDSVRGAERVALAMERGERITVIGDYDVDGVVSSAITHLFFEEIGYPVEIVIPNRFRDGYGITPQLIDRINADLVLTVDNGIHGYKSAEILKERGVDLIVTDHHNLSEKIPDAFAIINPKQPDCNYPLTAICGAEVIWLFLAVLKGRLSVDVDMNQYLDLVAVATISDVMPLRGVNHTVVKQGLKHFVKSDRPFNRVIMSRLFYSKSELFSEDVAFQIAPRLNSSGRLADATTSFELITAKSYSRAYELFVEIDSLNSQRKEVESEIFSRVVTSIDDTQNILLYYSETLHEGVIGIVASKVAERFHKPTIIFSLTDGVLKGSGRSVGNIDLFKIIESGSHLLLKWGGHKMAGGLSLELQHFSEFRTVVQREMMRYSKEDFKSIKDDSFGEIPLSLINDNLLGLLSGYEPYGERNEKPLFSVVDGTVKSVMNIGKNREFQKLIVEKDGGELEVLVFKSEFSFEAQETISFNYILQESLYRNRREIKGILQSLL